MLAPLPSSPSTVETHVSATTNETALFSISVTAGASANQKNATYTQLIASTTYESYGIAVQLAGLQTTASTNQRCLVDIAVGGAGSEQVIIPNLTCGNVADYVAASGKGVTYFFPIYIPKNVRIAATCQASTGADIVNVAVRLFQHLRGPGQWVGSRVTAYGANTGTSQGTSHTPGQNSYATGTQLIASTTNPIKAMQVGMDLSADTTAASTRMLARIGYGAGPTYVVNHLPIKESTTIECVDFTDANFLLSQMSFNIPAGQALLISAMRDAATPEGRGFVVYGVD